MLMRGLLTSNITLAGLAVFLCLMVGVQLAMALAPTNTPMLVIEVGHESHNRTELIAVDLGRDQLIRVTSGRDPQWSPDGRYLAYTRYVRNATRLFLRDMTSGDELAIGHDGRQSIYPAWTPQGDRLCWAALVGFGNAERSIDCYDTATGDVYEWLDINHSVQGLDFSPEGERLLMRSMFFATFMGSASSGKSAGYQSVLSADWSPDGDQLAAVVSVDYGHTELVLVEVDAAGRMDLSDTDLLLSGEKPSTRYSGPVWSPDNKHIAFLGEADNSWVLFLTELATGSVKRLTIRDDGNIRNAAWSPDGRYLYAIANEGLSTRILWWDTVTDELTIPDWSVPLNIFRVNWRPAS